MKLFNVAVWSPTGDGEIYVEIEAPDSLSACRYVEESLCLSAVEIEYEEDDEDYEEE